GRVGCATTQVMRPPMFVGPACRQTTVAGSVAGATSRRRSAARCSAEASRSGQVARAWNQTLRRLCVLKLRRPTRAGDAVGLANCLFFAMMHPLPSQQVARLLLRGAAATRVARRAYGYHCPLRAGNGGGAYPYRCPSVKGG